MVEGNEWLLAKVKGYGYKDVRLQRRLEQVVSRLCVSDMSKGFPVIFEDKHSLKAFYQLMRHSQSSHEGLLNCFAANLNLQAGQTYYVIQDTTSLNFSNQHEKEGMGYLHDLSQRGLWLHNGLVLSGEGVPEGMLFQQVIIRDDKQYGKKHQRAQRPFEEKESYKWVEGLLCASKATASYGCSFIHIMDREADVLGVIKAAWQHSQHFIIRASHDRRMPAQAEEPLRKLSEHLQQVEPLLIEQQLPSGSGKTKLHHCQLKWQHFDLEGQHLWVVQLTSLTDTSLQWMLLSDVQINNSDDALKLLKNYKKRWIIEELHKGMKTGCKVEKRQFSSLQATLNSIALLSLLSVWLLRIRLLAEQDHQQDLRTSFSAVEQQVLLVLAAKHLRPLQKQKLKELSAQWLAVLLGNMGGFVGNQDRHRPGWQTLWLGYLKYRDFLAAFSLGANSSSKDVG